MKETMRNKIEQLPKFRFRDVAVKEEQDFVEGEPFYPEREWVGCPSNRAITETTNTKPLAFVSKRYGLVQMKDVFMPLLNTVETLEPESNLKYYEGMGVMDLFPGGDSFSAMDIIINDDGQNQISKGVTFHNNRVGISAYNSVNKTSALVIKFSVLSEGRVFTLPRKAASFRRIHVGKDVKVDAMTYASFVGKIQDIWKGVLNKFMNDKVDDDRFDKFIESFHMSPKDFETQKLNIVSGDEPSAWEVCMMMYDHIDGATRYKSDVHKRKRLDKFVEDLIVYDMILGLGD